MGRREGRWKGWSETDRQIKRDTDTEIRRQGQRRGRGGDTA